MPGSPESYTFDQLLTNVSPEIAANLAKMRHMLDLAPGQVLYRQGEQSRGFFVVRGGSLQLFVESHNGSTLELALAKEGEALGLPATVNENAYVNTAKAVSKAKVEFYPVAEVQRLLRTQPACMPPFIRLVAAAVAQTEARKKKIQIALSAGRAV
jgi:CRP/FNR family transcriptional regulator